MAIKYNELPKKLFKVRVPIISTYSDMEIEMMGLPLQESTKGRITEIDEEFTNTMLPLTKIIDIYASNAAITLTDPSEVTEIYTALEKYISSTNSTSMDFNAPVIEDNRDIDIDRFASEMFNLNRHEIVNNTINVRSGFDIGIHKAPITTGGNYKVRNRHGVSAAFFKENTVSDNSSATHAPGYLTHQSNMVDPNKVNRKPRLRKRQKIIHEDT